MGLDVQTAMDAAAVDEFLARRETGVLALARDDVPYSIPISYGYDRDERTFYLRLVSTPDSEKRPFLADAPPCRLVVYEEDEPVYRSVVARGDLESMAPSDLNPEHIAQYGNAQRPLFEVWTEETADLDIELFVLDPEEIGGRRIDRQAPET